MFAVIALRIPSFWALPSYLVLAAGLVALSAIDVELKRLPTPVIVWTAISAGPLLVLASGITGRWSALLVAAAAAAACFGVFFAIFFLAPKGIGFGDVRLSALCGAWLGWIGPAIVPVGIFAGFVLAGIPAVVMLILGRASRSSRLAFGPFLAAGTIVGVCFGPLIVHVWPRF